MNLGGTGGFGSARIVAAVAIVAFAAAILALLAMGIQVVLAGFGGILLAVLLSAWASLLARHTPLTYGWSLAVVVTLILGLVGLGVWLLAAEVIQQVEQLSARMPTIQAEVQAYLNRFGWGRWILEETDNGIDSEVAAGSIGAGLTMLSRWSSYFLVAIFVGLFGAAHPKLYQDATVSLFPIRHRDRIRALINQLASTLRWWLIGQGLAMLLIGVSTMIVLFAFGIPGALVIGLLVGLAGFVPYLGPIIGAVPVAILAAIEGPGTMAGVMVAYVAVQTVEGYGLAPLIQQRTVYLPPAFTVFTQILMGMSLGALGFVLATPLAAAALVLTRFYRREILGDTAAEPPTRSSNDDSGES
ncbi:AI-2E family transporter [soil metagenome]